MGVFSVWVRVIYVFGNFQTSFKIIGRGRIISLKEFLTTYYYYSCDNLSFCALTIKRHGPSVR